MTKYYKFLTEYNRGEYSEFDYTEYLPKNGKLGKWLPKIDSIELCKSGYHAFEPKDILNWCNAQLFEVEFKGEIVSGEDKVAGQQMRFIRKIDEWNENTARKFACYCARDVLPIFEKKYPNDNSPRKAIEVAELFAEGKTTEEELSAARAAAWAAARAAARAEAWAAGWAAERDASMAKYTNKLLEMLGI